MPYDIVFVNHIYVITMAADFQVILEAEEEDVNQLRLENLRVFRDGYIHLSNNFMSYRNKSSLAP